MRYSVVIDNGSSGRDPLHSAKLIHQLALYRSIFSVIPSEAKSAIPDVQLIQDYSSDALGSATILHSLLLPEEILGIHIHPALLSAVKDDPSSKARIMLAILLTPFMGMTYSDKKNKIHPIVTSVIRDSLKLGTQNHFLKGIPTLFSSIPVIREHMENHTRNPLGRVKLGLLLRHKSVHNPATGNHWTTSFLFSLVTQLRPLYDLQNDTFNGTSLHANIFLELMPGNSRSCLKDCFQLQFLFGYSIWSWFTKRRRR